MIRSEFLDICGMAVPTFNSHRRNGDLPFRVSNTEAEDGAGRTWARYSLHDAARMLAARQLVNAQHVSWSEAARILRADAIHSGGVFKNYFDHPGVNIAQFEFVNESTNGDPVFYPRLQVLSGTLEEIVAGAENTLQAYNKNNRDHIIIASMVSVNLSNCWQTARSLAKSKGIVMDLDRASPVEN